MPTRSPKRFDYDLTKKAVVVPIGNAGNITAIMQGFLRLHDLEIIDTLPRVIGVQSRHADPVFRYYLEPDKAKRVFVPVTVQPSVAQAAMIGNPVSMPRVIRLVEEYHRRAGAGSVAVVQVSEQEIMDSMLLANRHGHIACTQGGESLAGFRAALAEGLLGQGRNRGAGRHRPPPEIHRLPADVLRRLLPAGIRSDAQGRIPEPAATAYPQDRQAGGENRGPGRADRRLAGVDPERLAGLPHRAGFLSFLNLDIPRRKRCRRPSYGPW